jgi:hypothetical protein
MSVDRRRAMIGAVHADPSIPPKWRRLSIRSSFFHAPQPETDKIPGRQARTGSRLDFYHLYGYQSAGFAL